MTGAAKTPRHTGQHRAGGGGAVYAVAGAGVAVVASVSASDDIIM